MTAVLSPAELDEVTRFGIHDLDILSDLGLAPFDEEPACCRGDAPATVREVRRCCGGVVLHCETHRAEEREVIEDLLLARGARCRTCFRVWIAPDTYDDFMRVVTL